MGLLDKIFGKKDNNVKPTVINRQRQDRVERWNEDGMDFIEYYNADKKPGQFYDATRVVFDKHFMKSANKTSLYDLYVSWFREDDANMFDPSTGREIGSRVEYTHVIAAIDPDLLEADDSYAEVLLKYLLEKNRVEQFMENGLKTGEELAQILETFQRSNPASVPTYLYPHGLYVGGVLAREDGNYTKNFDSDIGRIMHETGEMKKIRAQNKEDIENKRKARIAENQAEIDRLQAEIDSMGEQSEYDVR